MRLTGFQPMGVRAAVKPCALWLILAVCVRSSLVSAGVAGVKKTRPDEFDRPSVHALHSGELSKKRPVSTKASALMENIAREIVERGGSAYSTRKGNHIVLSEEGFDVFDRFHLWPLSSSGGASKPTEEKSVTLTWKDGIGTLAFHGLDDDKKYELVDKSSYDGLLVVRDLEDTTKFRIASSLEPVSITEPVTGMPMDMSSAWFVPDDSGGLFIEKATGKMIFVKERPTELGDHFIAQVGLGRFVLLPKTALYERMSVPFFTPNVTDKGANIEVALGKQLLQGETDGVEAFRLVDKKDPRKTTPAYNEIYELDDVYLAKHRGNLFVVSKDFSRSSELIAVSAGSAAPSNEGSYIRIPVAADEFAWVPKGHMNKAVRLRGTPVKLDPQKTDKVLLAEHVDGKSIHFLIDSDHPEKHSRKFYGQPTDRGLMWEVTAVIGKDKPGKASFFIWKDDISKRSVDFHEQLADFDGKLMVEHVDDRKFLSAKYPFEESPWFKGIPEIANASLLLKVGGNLQLFKRDHPAVGSRQFRKILEGVTGGIGHRFGRARTFDTWLLVEDTDGKRFWLSTEDHGILPFENGKPQSVVVEGQGPR